MNHKPVKHKSSVAFAVAIILGQFALGNIAQARAVDDWGYWDASTSAGPGSVGNDGYGNYNAANTNTTQSNSNQNFNGDQRIFGVNPELLTAFSQGSYVGYTLCYFNCDGAIIHDYNHQPKTAGTVSIGITQGSERVADRSKYVAPIFEWTNGKPFFVEDTSYFNAQLAVNGTFNGESFNLDDSQSVVKKTVTTFYYDYSRNNSEVYTRNESNTNSFYGNLYGGSSVAEGNIYTDSSIGALFYGKPVVATQIAEQMRLGQTYNFGGYSYNNSYVQIAVNFQNASWSGNWGQSYDYSNYNYETGPRVIQNGFSAAGGISGSTLTSNSVVGAGNAGVGFVTGGKVDATLVGAIIGTDASAAAIIGKTVVTVQQAVATTTVGDIFQAYGQGDYGCKGGCLD